MLEVEMKFPATNRTELIARLEGLGARQHEVLAEADHYFNAPDRDFARTDEALRLRRIGECNRLTYKGPKRDLQTKTRTEIELPLADGPETADKMSALLVALGYRPVAVVRKHRTTYRLLHQGFPVEACLDQVDGVGEYVELEITTSEAQLATARQAVQELAGQLGLAGSERRSYLEMWLERHAN